MLPFHLVIIHFVTLLQTPVVTKLPPIITRHRITRPLTLSATGGSSGKMLEAVKRIRRENLAHASGSPAAAVEGMGGGSLGAGGSSTASSAGTSGSTVIRSKRVTKTRSVGGYLHLAINFLLHVLN